MYRSCFIQANMADMTNNIKIWFSVNKTYQCQKHAVEDLVADCANIANVHIRFLGPFHPGTLSEQWTAEKNKG